MRYSFLLFILICFSCQPKHNVPVTIEIDSNWQFKKVSDPIWRSATVPGNIFSDLLDHQLIEDPFIANNEENVQWVSKTDWEYKTIFSVDEETFQKKNIELNFEGLDTYASVYLNDSLILKANNAFRQWNVNVKPILKPENELRLVFEHTSKYEEAEKAKLTYQLPEGNRIFTRKAQFQYGWDWGPKLNTSGIWRPIKLVAWNEFRVVDYYLKQFSLSDSISELGLILKTNSSSDIEYNIDLYIDDYLLYKYKDYNLYGNDTLNFDIEKPKRWWPHNLGEPYLYDIKVVVKDGNKILDNISVKHGIRTIDLVTEKDSIGESFYFKVNDVPVYAKGANYIPQHSFQNWVNDQHYEDLLDDVVDANMNMLRVWGGGIYENDIFYDLCDKKGILVWQDFMFACAMYPGDDTFLKNVRQEAEQQVKRLRNHASIALWCGNNENSEGWHRWGWQVDRSGEEKDEIWDNYLKVFDSILPNTVARLTDTDYWESSPKYGRGNPKYKTEGDAHDWWIWHDAYPFEHLEEHVPRFMSEFGFQSFPSYEVIRYINQNDSIEISSEGFKNHQKHSRGFQLIDEYMKRNFPIPDNAEDYVYMSQLLQAYGITKGIEAHRRAKPYNMGTLYWQLNDCWPAVSWSGIDYLGNWKALHYKLKHSFDNILISSKIENDTIKVYVINDNLEDINEKLRISIKDFDNNILWKDSKEVSIASNSSQIKYQIPLADISFPKDQIYLDTDFYNVEEHFFFVKPKDLKLKQGDFKTQFVKMDDGIKVIIWSDVYQKDVFLSTKYKGWFHNNFFDLYPGQRKWIYFKSNDERLDKVMSIDDLQIRSFNNFIRQVGY
ncbi:glycoside hydrolase family 2 protein [uncultured Winogradskyella sp.]|uniref:beta-mannosidase n=1 Tax=uncultured Winogradskyella sp. TaxID=395353 RepID=UPI002628A249|nr:glycoside hydrolase family 2 protein [uncultured Winogradskyella sp.]